MRNIQNIVCMILNQALFHTYSEYDYSGIDEETWQEVYQEFADHCILCIPAEILDQLTIPEDMKSEWKENIVYSSLDFFRMAAEQTEILDMLQKENIPVVILKGFAAAIEYPLPWLRSFGDIDLIVAPEDFERAKQVFVANKYILEDEEIYTNRFIHHIVFFKDVIHIELHRFFVGEEAGLKHKVLDDIIFENIEESEIGYVNQYDFPMLPTIPNGLVLLQHIVQHLYKGVGLRQILDWLLFAKHHITDQSWEEYREKADKVGLTDLAIHVTRMGQMYMGFPEEEYTWCKDADEEICSSLMEYIFQSGNFGNKMDADSKLMIGAMTKVRKDLFHNLQSLGEVNWQLLKKYPALKQFAWIYQGWKYVKYGFKNKDRISAIKASNQTSKELNNMMKKLGI